MIDTPQNVEKQFETMMMQKTPEERLRMGCSMFEAARKIVLSSLKEGDANLSGAELKRELFLRFYGEDFSEEEKEKILAGI